MSTKKAARSEKVAFIERDKKQRTKSNEKALKRRMRTRTLKKWERSERKKGEMETDRWIKGEKASQSGKE